MHRNHLLTCVAAAIAIALVLAAFGVPASTLVFVAALAACPVGMGLMMFFMMKGMQRTPPERSDSTTAATPRA